MKTDALITRRPRPAIVLVSHGFQPDYEAGFANGLAANGLNPVLVASDRSLIDRLLPNVIVRNLRGSQDEKRTRWQKASQMISYLFRLALMIAHKRPITHLNGLFALSHVRGSLAEYSWFLECLLYKALSRRLLMTVHNVLPHGRDTPQLRQRLAAIYRLPDRLIVHTERMRQRLIAEFDVEASRILVMQHGIDRIADVPAARVAAARESLGLTANQKLVLCFGVVQRYKGVDLIIRAARLLDENIRIHIAGYCYDVQYHSELEELRSDHPDKNQITLENAWLTEERADDLLAAADVLALPYRHIDQSGVLFAALRHGLPVVAFDVGSLSEYLTDGAGTVVESGNLEALADAIRRIECSAVARAHIRELAKHYLWSNTVRAILGEYESSAP